MKGLSLEIDLRRPERYHWIAWKYMGLIPPKAPGLKRTLYICYSIIIFSLLTVGFPLSIGLCFMIVESFQEFCEATFAAVTFTGESVKFLSILFIIPKLKLVTDTADRLHKRIKTDSELKYLKETMSEAYTMSMRISMVYISAVLSTELISFLNTLISERALTFPGWFPVDWQGDQKMFYICHFYQFFGSISGGLQAIVSNTYVLVYIQYYVGHVKALRVRVLKIGENPEANRHDDFMELIECIKDHQHIIR